MRFTNYFAFAIATLAFQAMSLPTFKIPARELNISQRDLPSISKLLDIVKDLATLPKLASIPKVTASSKRSSTVEERKIEIEIEIEIEPSPVAGSEYNKKSAISESKPEEFEETLIRRATTMDPNVGMSTGLPSGIVMFMIIFMLYAMITAISMKDTD